MKPDRHTPGKSRRAAGGQTIIELGLLLPLLLLLLFGAGDLARAFYTSVTLTNAAGVGAMFGSRSVDAASDVAGITQAARNDAQNLIGMVVTATKYCQCSDGSSILCSSTSCAGGARSRLYSSVTTQYLFRTLASYPGIPPQLLLTKRVVMRAR